MTVLQGLVLVWWVLIPAVAIFLWAVHLYIDRNWNGYLCLLTITICLSWVVAGGIEWAHWVMQ